MENQQVVLIDPKSIHRPAQVRTEFKATPIEELMDSIRAVGILQPVQLRRDGTRLVPIDGERRIRAALALSLATIPAIIVEKELNEADVLQRQLIANCIREDLSAMEQARGIHNLMVASGCTAAEAAGRIGKSAGTVSKLLSLLTAPESVQAKLQSGEIGIKAAYDLARTAQAPATAAKPAHRSKLTAVLDAARSITVQGTDSTIDAFIAVLDELLSRTKAARRQGVELPTYLAMLKDQAKA